MGVELLKRKSQDRRLKILPSHFSKEQRFPIYYGQSLDSCKIR